MQQGFVTYSGVTLTLPGVSSYFWRRYPCQNQGAQGVPAVGHSTEAGKVQFNANGSVLLSIGTDSRVILQHAILPSSS